MSPRRQVVVTGLGVVNAAGQDVEQFRAAILAGKVRTGPITRFDATGFPVQVAGEISGFKATDHIPRRFVAKTDRFTHFALACCEQAIGDAGLRLDTEDLGRIGVWFGNNTGGWDLCEQGFDEYYTQGADVVNPWQATAWFLAAPQGFATIRYGLRGMSKSFSGDRTSGASAVYYGTRAIEWGRNDVVLTGGCEAPVSPLAMLCFHSGGELSTAGDPAEAYRPFAPDGTGLVVGEGGVVLVLEDADRAAARGAPVHARVLGGAHGTVPTGGPAGYAEVIRRALADAACTPEQVDLVLAEGVGTPDGDGFELAALGAVFGARPVPLAVPKPIFGHLYGAGFGTDVLCGVLAARDAVVPPTPGAGAGLATGPSPSGSPRPGPVDRFLVTSHSRYGSCLAMVFGRGEPSGTAHV
jgi:3-oxoacyl-(acyl-carrier-protein) synthase